jgi:hypothetical protein
MRTHGGRLRAACAGLAKCIVGGPLLALSRHFGASALRHDRRWRWRRRRCWLGGLPSLRAALLGECLSQRVGHRLRVARSLKRHRGSSLFRLRCFTQLSSAVY